MFSIEERRVEVNVGRDSDITIVRRLKDQRITNVVARQYKRRLDNTYVLYYDLIDYDETFVYEEEIVSGKPVVAKAELERRFDANVVLWGSEGKPKDWDSNKPGAYVDLHDVGGRVERTRTAIWRSPISIRLPPPIQLISRIGTRRVANMSLGPTTTCFLSTSSLTT